MDFSNQGIGDSLWSAADNPPGGKAMKKLKLTTLRRTEARL
jgi:hypothetical protein